tara:strand:+ start:406 stop:729 length:324 start_codon:yes stop_codon:yes gene_type:complete
MSEGYNWCHGPNCHKKVTLDRVRGVKGSKVLRTRKIPINTWNKETIWRLFCSQNCLMDFVHKHTREMIALEPRFEPLETPIENPTRKTHTTSYGYSYTDTKIEVRQS